MPLLEVAFRKRAASDLRCGEELCGQRRVWGTFKGMSGGLRGDESGITLPVLCGLCSGC